VDCTLHVIDNGESALQYLKELEANTDRPCPRVVLLDLNLPRTHGFDVLRHIRQTPRCGETSVVILTSSDVEKDRIKAKELGAALYITKPSDLKGYMQVGEIIKTVLGG
jgi:DNA-binding response OmpR family regulator